MSETTWHALRRLLVRDYALFRSRLARQVGSEELASEALQDTWLRLARGGQISDHLESPRGYLYRIAFNFARGRARSDRRRLEWLDIEEMLDPVDQAPGPAEIEEGRSDMRAMARALEEMPQRRREIFVLAWFEDLSPAQIADRYGLSPRMIQIELKQAREHIAERLEGRHVVDFAARRSKASEE
ncbi:sigma-70 family RNA polymerase sigma factor [Sphingomonas sp. KR3-1]|uniref:RNA polymerase sigma factor n=1 Tax=Sphingomonas sp. KR3-1 TaxID=3156611 RepID=UPI0032B43083